MSDDQPVLPSVVYLFTVGPDGQATVRHADGQVHDIPVHEWDRCSTEEVVECALLQTTG